MSDYVDPQIIDAVNQTHAATLGPEVMKADGAGKAYHAVAQAAAMAIQDAAHALRNATTVSTAAVGGAMAQFLATGDPAFLAALGPMRQMIDHAIADYVRISEASMSIVERYPSG